MKKNIVKTISLCLVAMMDLAFAGCGKEVKEIDAKELASKLVSDISYLSKPEELSAEEIGFYIELEEGVTGVMYMSSGETAEEVAVFTAPDEDTALSVKEALEDFLEEQSDAFKNYEPETVERIDDAVLEQRGVYVIMCVSDESQKAVDIIKEAFGE